MEFKRRPPLRSGQTITPWRKSQPTTMGWREWSRSRNSHRAMWR